MFRVVEKLTRNLLQNSNIGLAAVNSLSFSSHGGEQHMPEFKANEVATADDMKLGRDHYSSVMTSHKDETDEEFDQRFINEFTRPDVDGWYVRRAMLGLQQSDVVPETAVINAALRACRKLNDYALAVRFLEAIKDKCGNRVNEIYPYVIQEAKPILDELGISTPEEMGYGKPEFHVPSVDWWPKEYYKMYNIRERTVDEVLGPKDFFYH